MKANRNMFGEHVTIEIVQGGFILTYPIVTTDDNGNELSLQAREVFVSPRKLNQKIKDVIASVGLVADDDKDDKKAK